MLVTTEILLGNVKLSVRALVDYIKANNLHAQLSPERQEWLERVQKSQQDAIRSRKDKAYKYGPDHPRYRDNPYMHHGYLSQIIRETNEELYGSANRVMIDGYTMSDFVMPYLQFTRPASCLTANDYAGVGHGVGQSIGAAIADLENGCRIPQLALMGDSGMMNAGWDISVAVDYKLPIVYLVTNNGGWMPAMKYAYYGPNWDNLGPQDRYGAQWHNIPQQGEERPREGIQFTRFAESIGAQGMLCNRSENFREDLKRAYALAEKNGPVIMDCIMDHQLCNSAIIGPAYALMFAHLPYDEMPRRGKAARKKMLGAWFPGLANEPQLPLGDHWEPITEDEYGYEPVEERMK